MSEIILSTKDLSKKYSNMLALDNLNMTISKGQIYGFIGENGAGKTTLMRIVGGLIFETRGSFELFGADTVEMQNEARKRISCMIEAPKFYADLTAKENLIYIAKLRKIELSRVNKLMDLVSLNSSKKSAKHLSQGQKQRLGLAIALISEPEFLMLDEPINGLDPQGISVFRELIKNINEDKGTTILISSHLLSELFQIATSYGFIHKGKIIQQISADELKINFEEKIVVTINYPTRAEEILRKEKIQYTLFDHTFTISENIEKIIELISDCGIHHIANSAISLEDYYFNLINTHS